MKILKTLLVMALAAQPFVAAPSFALSTTPTFKPYDVHGNFSAIAYGNGRYVAVGESGKIVTSTNGTTWSFSPTTMATIKSVVYNPANKLFYVMSIDSTGKNHYFYSSSDGASWTSLSNVSSSGLSFQAVFSFANGKFFAGGNNLIYSSSDAKTWTLWTRAAGATPAYFGRVVWGNSTYVVAVLDIGLDRSTSWSSTTGTSWSEGATFATPSGKSVPLPVAAFGNGTFVAAADYYVSTSTNGAAWTQSNLIVGAAYNKVIYNSGWKLFDATGSVWTSATAAAGSWTQVAQGDTTGLFYAQDVATNGTVYISAGNSGLLATAASNLASWTVNNAAAVYGEYWSGAYREVASNGTTLLATDGSVLKSSTDGVTWKDITASVPVPAWAYGSMGFRSVKASGGYFYMTLVDQSSEAVIVRTKDLVNWQVSGSWSEDEPLYFATNTAGLTLGVSNREYSSCVRFGASTTVFDITEGGYFTSDPVGIACSGTRFMVVLANGQALASTDGVTWTAAGTVPAGATSIAYLNSKFIVATPSGIYTCSSTGTSWTKNSFAIPATETFLSVANGKLFLTGDNGYVAYSSDASSWKVLTKVTTNKVYSVASNSAVYVSGTAALLNGEPTGVQKGTLLISK